MFQKKIMITGGTGYIGNYITKTLAHQRPEIQIISLNKWSSNDARKRDDETSGFKNVKFLQGDALKPETFRDEMKDCDAVIHTVGSMLEGVSYSNFLEKAKDWLTTGKYNPMEALFRFRKENNKEYDEESLEAKNKDSTRIVAETFDQICLEKGKRGHFVFLSAEQVQANILKRYLQLKKEAEDNLLNEFKNIEPVILRPAFVWHESEKVWSIPAHFALDFGHATSEKVISKLPGGDTIQKVFPKADSIHLDLLTEYCIKGALGDLDNKVANKIWTNDMMNNKEGL